MKLKDIKSLQKKEGVEKLQSLISSGQVWKLEGSMGRMAMAALEDGACFLPSRKEYKGPGRITDFYGSVIPFRDELEPGSKGTLLNTETYYQTRYN